MYSRGVPIRLPTEHEIRRRLSLLATEANTLRALLRLIRSRQKSRRSKEGVSNA